MGLSYHFRRKKSRRKIKSLIDLLSLSYDNSVREEENLDLEGIWVYKFMIFPSVDAMSQGRINPPSKQGK